MISFYLKWKRYDTYNSVLVLGGRKWLRGRTYSASQRTYGWLSSHLQSDCSSPSTANLSHITDLIHNIGKLPLRLPVFPFNSGLDWLEEPQPQPLQAIKPGRWGCHQPAVLSWASADGSSQVLCVFICFSPRLETLPLFLPCVYS